jgi:Ricin-type beta-trefoil lectin domain
MMGFVFEQVPANQVAAVVLRVNGKFYIRQINAPESEGNQAPNGRQSADQRLPTANSLGPVRLVAQQSGKCLEAKSVPSQSVPATQQTCNDASAQRWSFRAVAGGYQIVSAVDSTLCLNLRAATQAQGARVWLSACSEAGMLGGIWRVEPAGNGYSLIAAHSAKCMDVSRGSTANGVAILQYTCHGSLNQIWSAQTQVWSAARLDPGGNPDNFDHAPE